MLSILIPTYNYNVYPLVLELKKQADSLSIAYEILVQDDASTIYVNENRAINQLTNCSYQQNHENSGRGNNINSLNFRAKFDYVLIMEADAFPEKDTYLQDLITSIHSETQVVFGGVTYLEQQPEKDNILRWKYGKKRESIPLLERLKKPYHFVFTWNLLAKKEILSNYRFPNHVKDYGYEDVVFIKQLKENKIDIQHIENRLIHLNSESSATFIGKTEKAVTTLHQLINSNTLDINDTKIGQAYQAIQSLYLSGLITFLFKILKKRMIANLIGSNPNLMVLDFYKLGYFCFLNQKKHV